VDVHIFDQQNDLKFSHSTVKAAVKEILFLEKKGCDEVTIHFVDTPTICALHSQFFNDPSTTDCISLPMDSPEEKDYCVLGEVFICPKTAIDYAKKHRADAFYEVTLYLAHGILHLLGYEDYGAAEPEMRAAENRHMQNLKQHDLLIRSNI
jgi:probable rRNA maturation factor